MRCAKKRNTELLYNCKRPINWNNSSPEDDNWPMTNNSRCDLYSSGVYMSLDVDLETGPGDYSDDEDQIIIIGQHCGRGRNGGFYESDN